VPVHEASITLAIAAIMILFIACDLFIFKLSILPDY